MTIKPKEPFKNKIIFILYHFLLRITFFSMQIFNPYLPLKWQRYQKERRHPHLVWKKAPHSNQRRIWFHAASGEVEYIKPLLKLWKSQYPEDLLFLTYFSTSALDLIPRISELDGWAPLPVDLPKPCQIFIETLNPYLFIIARTDLWPTLLKTLHNTPKVLVASTWSEGSKKTQGLGRFMSQWCLPYLNEVCVVSQEDRTWIQNHISKAPEIHVTGDPRFDQVQTRLELQRPLPLNLRDWIASSQRKVFIAGSTWEEDEEALFDSFTSISPSQSQWIIVPHESHPVHLQKIKAKLHLLQIPFLLWSEEKNKPLSSSCSLLIFDEKGWLAELYQLADIAFIGGSFKRQVHSVMEALGCGLPVIVGPYYKNNREAIEFSQLSYQTNPFVMVVAEKHQGLQHYIHLISCWDNNHLQEMKRQIQEAFIKRCGATAQTFQELQKYLD